MVTQEELEKMSPEEIAELQKQNCIFCKITSGEIPAKKVYEDDLLIAFMDINPARKGHVLLIPKEHIPIFPLMPPETFKRMFDRATIITKALKSVTLSSGYSMFAANGAVAGQQIPHAVLHLFPREQGDALNSLVIPQDNSKQAENDQLKEALANNLGIMMKGYLEREGRVQAQTPTQDQPSNQAQTQQQEPTLESTQSQMSVEQAQQVRREHIAKMLEENTQVREALKDNPEEFKQLVNEQDQLKALFAGVDIDGLSQKLKTIDEQFQEIQAMEKPPQQEQNTVAAQVAQEEQSLSEVPEPQTPKQEEPLPTPETPPEVTQEQPLKEDLPAFNTQEQIPSPETPDTSIPQDSTNTIEETTQDLVEDTSPESQIVEEVLDASLTDFEKEIFLGEHPQKQKETVLEYFERKPQAKALFIEHMDQFQELLAGRLDVQPIFANINLEKLQIYLMSGHDVAPEQSINDDEDDTSTQETSQPEKKNSLESMIGGAR